MRKALFLAASLLVACSSPAPKVAPVIDDLTVPTDLAIDTATNTYKLPVKVAFHDADDDVTAMHVEIPTLKQNGDIPFPDTSLVQTLTITVPASFKGQTLTLSVSVKDQSGLFSEAQFRSVKLL
jgi:hypothetical protein